ncbi:MAG: nitronate monooxygenase, partial [Clostridia bacterium]|nr:nitronate monooxygenase [Clostridia bacterium]
RPFEEKYEVKIPVVVAGGIFDGKDIAHYLQLGASGVQMGTRFVATEECNADLDFKMSYVHAKTEDIRLVKSPVGMPGRAIENDFTRKLDEGNIPVKRCYNCLIPCDPRTTPYCISDALIHSAEGTEGLIFAGSNAFRVNEIISVKELMRKLIEETREHLDS